MGYAVEGKGGIADIRTASVTFGVFV